MFGNRLKQLRKEKGLSQKELGNLLNLSDRVVGYYEANRHFPDGDVLVKIADIFEVSLDYLLGRTDIRAGFTATHKVNGQVVTVATSKENFPEGFTEKDAAEYLEISKLIETLGLTNDELNLILKSREFGIKLQDLDLLNKLKTLGIKFEENK